MMTNLSRLLNPRSAVLALVMAGSGSAHAQWVTDPNHPYGYFVNWEYFLDPGHANNTYEAVEISINRPWTIVDRVFGDADQSPPWFGVWADIDYDWTVSLSENIVDEVPAMTGRRWTKVFSKGMFPQSWLNTSTNVIRQRWLVDNEVAGLPLVSYDEPLGGGQG